MKLRYYISGHGLGHASRSCQIITTLRQRHPRLEVEVSSPARRWFLDNNLQDTPLVATRRWDIGVVQHDSLTLDLPASVAAYDRLYAQREALVEREADNLLRVGVDLIACDLPALPFAAAEQVGIPSVGIGNFDWTWIYRGLAASYPEMADGLLIQAERFHSDYQRATLLLRLPMAAPADSFQRRCDVPLVARAAHTPKATIRDRLGIPAGKRLGLISFGGFGLQQLDLRPLAKLHDWVFVLERGIGLPQANLIRLCTGAYYYPDLVAAADAVITKPGYGIVSEAIANHTAVLYTKRGNFPEEPLLIDGLQRYARCQSISNTQLRAGDWGESLAALMKRPAAEESIACNGERVVADRLAELLEGLP